MQFLMKTAQWTVQFYQNLPKISNFLRPSKLPKVKINKDWENFFARVKFTLFKINFTSINVR